MSLKIKGSSVFRNNDESGGLIVERGVINTIDKNQRRKIILNVLKDIADTVGHTLGPFGSYTLLTEPYGASPVVPSKDGFRIMTNIRYDNPIYDSVYRVSRDISSRLNQLVGDSTTTGNEIVYWFYKEVDELLNDKSWFKFWKKKVNITPAGVDHILKEIQNQLIEILKDTKNGYIKDFKPLHNITDEVELAKEKLHREEIYSHVGTIAANNDKDIGERIAKLFSINHSPETFINVERADGDETHIEADMGFEMSAGHIHRLMATEQDGIVAQYEDPMFLLIDGPLTGHDIHAFGSWVEAICLRENRPLVVIASEYTQELMNLFIQSRAGYEVARPDGTTEMRRLPIIALMIDGSNDFGSARLRDLEVVLGAHALPTKDGKLFNPPKSIESLIGILGNASMIKTAPFFSRILGGKGDREVIQARINELQKDLDNRVLLDSMGSQAHVATIQKRIAMLSGRMSTIYVGGSTYKEKESKRQVYEDAVCAIRSTIEHGYTLGGNVSVPNAINKYHREVIIKNIIKALYMKKANVCLGNSEADMRERVDLLLTIVERTFTTAYEKVLSFAGFDKRKIKNIIKKCTQYKDITMTYNLMIDDYEVLNGDRPAELLVAGNTDVELIKAIFAVSLTFLTSDQLMTLYHPGVK